MQQTKYYYLDVNFYNVKILDMDLLIHRVNCYNNNSHFIFFNPAQNSYEKYSAGKMSFIYIFKTESYKTDNCGKVPAEVEISELSSLFEASIVLTPIDYSKLSVGQMRTIKSAKNIFATDHNLPSLSTNEWVLKTQQDITDEVNSITWFSEFRLFYNKISNYIENVRKIGVKGNYNIVLINNCGVDTDKFIKIIFHIYLYTGVISCAMLYKNSLEDAIFYCETDVPFLYHIDNMWEMNDLYGDTFTLSRQAEGLWKLTKKETIYITAMSPAEYKCAVQVDSFKALFAHTIEINDLSEEDKIEYIAAEAAKYGFTADKDSMKESGLKKLGISAINEKIATIVKQKMLQAGNGEFKLYASDFIEDDCRINLEASLNTLDALIGLRDVKTRVREIITYFRKTSRAAQNAKNHKYSMPCMHMVFRGNPGTGKTTVARLIGKILAESGILRRRNVFVETSREELVGKYVGHTASKTADKVKEAMGGVLFIDEAYSIGLYDDRHDFGIEAIATLVKLMEDHKDDFICIMAGYNEEMDQMININPGLRHRVQFYIDFPDYSVDELFLIYRKFCANENYTLTSGASQAIRKYLGEILSCRDKHFANARIVKKVYERTKIKQAIRTDTSIINKCDIEAVIREQDMVMLIRRAKNNFKIGFGI